MVSRIRYPHIPNHYFTGKKPFSYLLKLLLALGALVVNRQATLAVVFCGFALSAVVRVGYLKIRHKDRVAPVAPGSGPPEEYLDQPAG